MSHQPALRLQFAADSSQGEEGWGAVCWDKLLPEKLYIEAKVQCAGQAVRISVHLPDDLQARRQLVRRVYRGRRHMAGEVAKTYARGQPRAPISLHLANPNLSMH